MGRTVTAPKEDRIDLDPAGDGQAYLYRRSGNVSGIWHFRANFPPDRIRKSTGISDPVKAKAAGLRLLAEARARAADGKKVDFIDFPKAAALWEKWMGEPSNRKGWHGWESDKGVAKRRHDFRRMLHTHILPFIADVAKGLAVDQITEWHLAQYHDWREKRRIALITEQGAALAARRAELRAKWEASSRLQKIHPDLEAWLPNRRIGNTQPKVSASALHQENSIVHHVLRFAAAELQAAKERTLPRMPRVKLSHRPREGFRDDEMELIRATAAKRFRDARYAAIRDYLERSVANGTIQIPEREVLMVEMAAPNPDGEGDVIIEYDANEGNNPGFRSYLLTKIPESVRESVWKTNPTAWARFRLLCVIDLLAGSGMRPSTLVALRRRHVLLKSADGVSSARLKKRTALAAAEAKIDWTWLNGDTVPPPPPEPTAAPDPNEPPPYMLAGTTRKGKGPDEKVRKWEIVLEYDAAAALHRMLENMPDDPNALLVPVTASALNKALKKVLEECGLDSDPDPDDKHPMESSLYMLRHRYINNMLNSGSTIDAVAANVMSSADTIRAHYLNARTQDRFVELRGKKRGADLF